MLKNQHLVQMAEREFASAHPRSPAQSWAAMEDMYQFASRFARPGLPPERSPHVQALLKLAAAFKRLRHVEAADA